MFNGKFLFAVFNTALKSYSSKIVNVANSKPYLNTNFGIISVPIIKSNYSTSSETCSFDEVKKITTDENVVLIDVREPLELIETGSIPGSINIPLGDIEVAFAQTPADLFLKKYGRPKPTANDPIVFSCRSGKRSLMAQTIVKSIGYLNTKNYEGGWLDWETNNK